MAAWHQGVVSRTVSWDTGRPPSVKSLTLACGALRERTTLSLATRGTNMEKFYDMEVEAKEEAVKETSDLEETKVHQKILKNLDKDKDSLSNFCSLKTGQHTAQATLSTPKTDAITSLRSGDDKIKKSGSSEKTDFAKSYKDRKSKKHSLKSLQTEELMPKSAASSLQEGNSKSEVSDSCRLEWTKTESVTLSSKKDSTLDTISSSRSEDLMIENSRSLEGRRVPDVAECNNDGGSKKQRSKLLPIGEITPEAVEDTTFNNYNLLKRGSTSAESLKDGDSKESFEKLKTEENTSEDVQKFSEREVDTAGNSEPKRKCRPSLRHRLHKQRLTAVKLLGETALKKGQQQVLRTSSGSKTGTIVSLRRGVSSLRKEGTTCHKSNLLKRGLTSREAFIDVDGKESSKRMKREDNTVEDVEKLSKRERNTDSEPKRNCRLSLRRRLRSKGIRIPAKTSLNKRNQQILETSVKDKDSLDNFCLLETEQNTSQATSSALKTDAIASLRSEEDMIWKSGLLEKSDTAESNKDEESKKHSLISLQIEGIISKSEIASLQEGNNNPEMSDSCRLEQTKTESVALSSKRDHTAETSDSLEIRNSGPLEPGESRLKAAISSLRSGDPKIQKSGSSEKPDVAESKKDECNKQSLKSLQTGEITPKAAVSSSQEGSNPSVYDSCRIEQSDPLEIEQKKFEAKEVSQKEVVHNSGVHESSKKDDSTLNNSCIISDKSGTEVKNESGTGQVSTVKKKKKKKKKKKSKVVGGDLGAHTQKQENLDKTNANKKKINPPKPQAKQIKNQKRLHTTPEFSLANMWQYSPSNIPIWQESLSAFPPVLPLMSKNPLGNSRHILYHQSILGSPGFSSLIQGNLLGNQVTPLMNQEPFLGISPLMQVKLTGNQGNPGNLSKKQMNASLKQANRPSYQGNPSGDPGNLAQYYENLVDQPRNHSMIWNEVNPPNNDVKLEKPDRNQGSQGRLSRWESLGSLSASQDSKGRLSRWEPTGNIPGSEEYPSRYQEDLLAQPSTSRSEVQSGDSYHSGECSSGSQKREGSRDSHSPDDYKRTRSAESESTPRNIDLTKVIISKDFGKLRLGQEELMLIRIAISQEIDRIPKGHIPKFNDTFLKIYGIIVDCADEWSRDWLADTITKISPWSGARLRLVDPPLTDKFYDSVLFIPGMIEKAEIILGRLERQNPALKTGNWKVYSVEEKCDEKGFNLKLGIPLTSMKALQELNFKPFLGMTKVTITISKSVRIVDL